MAGSWKISCYNRIQLGLEKTKGLVGTDPIIGKDAAESIDLISEELRNTNIHLMLSAKAGTGASLKQVLQKISTVTVAIISTPFNFEGTKRMNLALQGLEEAKAM